MIQPSVSGQGETFSHTEDVEIRGHIIDSLILPKILDCICAGGGSFHIKEIAIGQTYTDASYALVEVGAPDEGSPSGRGTRGRWPTRDE